MIWLDDELKNPLSGAKLTYDSPHSLTDGANRFPVIENIPFLRVNRDDLCARVLERLDADDERGALFLLLQDRDDWATGDAPEREDLQPLLDDENLNLRGAMKCLKYGAVADYFAYRWSDPTFLSGLRLLENHLPRGAKNVFELCCGIGHFLREFDLRGLRATGADVVFSKLWLARKFVAPDAKLVCFDANYDFPFAGDAFDAAFCHDAFYFLPEKRKIADQLKRTTNSALLIGHAHNSEAENHSSGAAVSTAEYAALFENSVFYDDAELTKALIENRLPISKTVDELEKTEAVSWATSNANSLIECAFDEVFERKNLLINPLFENGDGALTSVPNYPSERYENEYGALSDYLFLTEEQIIKLEISGVKNLTEAEKKDLARRRILLNLPKHW